MVTGLQIAILPVDFAISLSLLFSSSKSSKSSTDFERALPTFRGPILFIYWIGTEKLMTAVNGCSACDSYLLYQSVCSPLVYPSGTLLKVKVERVDKRCSKESLCQYQFVANYLCINRSVKAATNHFKKTYCVVPFLVLARSKTPHFFCNNDWQTVHNFLQIIEVGLYSDTELLIMLLVIHLIYA